MSSSSNVPVFIQSDYRLDPYAIICSARHKFSMAFSAIIVSTWNKWQHCLRIEDRSSLLKQVASALSKQVQCLQWSSQCQCQDLIFSFQAGKCYQDLLYPWTLAKGLPTPLTSDHSSFTSEQLHHAPGSYFQYSELGSHLPFLQHGKLKNWRNEPSLSHSTIHWGFFTTYFSAGVCCVNRKLLQWLQPCAPCVE